MTHSIKYLSDIRAVMILSSAGAQAPPPGAGSRFCNVLVAAGQANLAALEIDFQTADHLEGLPNKRRGEQATNLAHLFRSAS